MQPLASTEDVSFVAELRKLGIETRQFRRAAARGDAVRIHRGAHLSIRLCRHRGRLGVSRECVRTGYAAHPSRRTVCGSGRPRGESRTCSRLPSHRFGDPLSGSAGESVSRAAIHEWGFPPPILQQRFDDRLGLVGFTDFWWPEFRLVGEFDGLVTYTGNQFRNGRTIEQVVIDEKRREDRIRALGPSFSRWEWADAIDSRRLFTILRHAGLPSSRHAA